MGRTVLVGIVAAMLVAPSWAQGSKPKSADQEKVAPSITTSGDADVSMHRVKVKERLSEVTPEATEIYFVGEGGKVSRKLKLDGRKILSMVASRSENAAIIIEATEHYRTTETPWFEVHYYNARGEDVWKEPICCDLGGDIYRQVVMSDDASIIAIHDMGAGGMCDLDEEGITAPPGCVGLRIFTAEGKEMLRVPKGGGAKISENGRFVIFHDAAINPDFKKAGWRLWDVGKKRFQDIPSQEAGTPLEIDDSGEVRFYWSHAPNSPGRQRYRFIPGKGLEKAKD